MGWNGGRTQIMQYLQIMQSFLPIGKKCGRMIWFGGMYRNELSYNCSSGSWKLPGEREHWLSVFLIAWSEAWGEFQYWLSSSFLLERTSALTGDTTSYSHSNRTRFNIDPSLQYYFSTRNYRHRSWQDGCTLIMKILVINRTTAIIFSRNTRFRKNLKNMD